MKAIVLNDFGSTDNFTLDLNYPRPKPGTGEVLVKIEAVGFNPIDYQMRLGKTEKKRMHSNILGREFSGTVIQPGTDVKNFVEGDRVFAASGSMGSNGTYAEYIVVPAPILAKIPTGLSFEEAAAIPTAYLTARQAISRLPLNNSDSVFIAGGAGGVGLAIIKLLLTRGVRDMVTTAGNADSRQRIVETGFPEKCIIDYREANYYGDILAANQERPFRHTIDLVGGKLSEVCAELLSVHGSYADITALSSSLAREKLFEKGAAILLISNYAHSLIKDYTYFGENLSAIAEQLTTGKISAPTIEVVGQLSVGTVSTAHHKLEGNKTHGKKLVMQIDSLASCCF